jgi:PhnB protein
MTRATRAVPEGYHSVTPQLTLDDAAKAIDWYKRALGAEELGRMEGPDGKIAHAVLRIGDSRIMLNDEMGGGKSARALGGSPVSMYVYVDDADAVFNRAVAAGGKVSGAMGQMADQFWGDRAGTITDPHGLTWWIASHREDLTPQEKERRAADAMKQAPQPAHR